MSNKALVQNLTDPVKRLGCSAGLVVQFTIIPTLHLNYLFLELMPVDKMRLKCSQKLEKFAFLAKMQCERKSCINLLKAA